ncbi:uncharacterized protein METZ01_LOCUS434454, partial [marine metagenome]
STSRILGRIHRPCRRGIKVISGTGPSEERNYIPTRQTRARTRYKPRCVEEFHRRI